VTSSHFQRRLREMFDIVPGQFRKRTNSQESGGGQRAGVKATNEPRANSLAPLSERYPVPPPSRRRLIGEVA
jgi:AraC-like DNA-binding protein